MTDAKIEELKQRRVNSHLKDSDEPEGDVWWDLLDYAESLTSQLSAIRDAGDVEVERLTNEIQYQLRTVDIIKLRDIAISRGQQIATLAAERDEARKGENTQCTIRYMLQDELDAVKAELAALKSAPGMEEIEEHLMTLLGMTVPGKYLTLEQQGRAENAAQGIRDLARRSIAAREEEKKRVDEAEHAMLEAVDAINEDYREVVGLLNHILSCIITVRQENTSDWMEYIAEEVNKVNEAIGDPDRVVVNCCDIVIVRGKSEILEGK